MSKSITIAEGSQAKNFNNVHKLRTNLIGGGTQYWVPEDEAGAYANMGQKTITSNGTYRASDDSKDGYSQVIVNVPPKEAHLTTKSISENGIYRGIDDGVDGFSQVNVNVAGVGEATVVLDEPIGGDGNEHHISADPTTGKPIDTVLPSSITITTMPTTLVYTDGQTIDKTGMVVKAYKNDGTIWESTGYTGGVIPLSELVLDPATAEIDPYERRKTNGHGLNVIEVNYTVQRFDSIYTFEEYALGAAGDRNLGTYNGVKASMGAYGDTAAAKLYFTRYNNLLYVYRVSGSNRKLEAIYKDVTTGYWTRVYAGGGTSELGTWVMEHSSIDAGFNWSEVPVSTVDPMNASVDNLRPAGVTVKVKWARPKDNKELMASFPITVNPAS